MNNLNYFRNNLVDNKLHTIAHCVAETGKCFVDLFDIKQDIPVQCKRQGVSDSMNKYFICRKCMKDWLLR